MRWVCWVLYPILHESLRYLPFRGAGLGTICRDYAKVFTLAPGAVGAAGIISVRTGLRGPLLLDGPAEANVVPVVEELDGFALATVARVFDVEVGGTHGRSPSGDGLESISSRGLRCLPHVLPLTSLSVRIPGYQRPKVAWNSPVSTVVRTCNR